MFPTASTATAVTTTAPSPNAAVFHGNTTLALVPLTSALATKLPPTSSATAPRATSSATWIVVCAVPDRYPTDAAMLIVGAIVSDRVESDPGSGGGDAVGVGEAEGEEGGAEGDWMEAMAAEALTMPCADAPATFSGTVVDSSAARIAAAFRSGREERSSPTSPAANGVAEDVPQKSLNTPFPVALLHPGAATSTQDEPRCDQEYNPLDDVEPATAMALRVAAGYVGFELPSLPAADSTTTSWATA